jgi:hypothetical protein
VVYGSSRCVTWMKSLLLAIGSPSALLHSVQF